LSNIEPSDPLKADNFAIRLVPHSLAVTAINQLKYNSFLPPAPTISFCKTEIALSSFSPAQSRAGKEFGYEWRRG
jgi:hypothetical protein